MKTVLNFTEHGFDFHLVDRTPDGGIFVDPKKKVTFPRGGVPRNSDTGAFEPGKLDVDESTIDAMMADDIARTWFGPGLDGKPQLEVRSKDPKPQPKKPAERAA